MGVPTTGRRRWTVGKRRGARVTPGSIDRLLGTRSDATDGVDLVWTLGKLFDESLEPYFADLVKLYVEQEDLFSHLHQTLIALDNLGVIDSTEHGKAGWSNARDQFLRMQGIGTRYLRRRAERSSR